MVWNFLASLVEGFCGSKETPPKCVNVQHCDGFMTKEERRLLDSSQSGSTESELRTKAAPESPASPQNLLHMAIRKLKDYRNEDQPKMRIILQQEKIIKRLRKEVRSSRKRSFSETSDVESHVVSKRASH